MKKLLTLSLLLSGALLLREADAQDLKWVASDPEGHGALYTLGPKRVLFVEGTPEQMLDSLDRLAALDGELEVCCGHEYTLANARFALEVEPENEDLRQRFAQATLQRAAQLPTLPSTLDQERRTNPFLRCDQPGPKHAEPRNRAESFATLRAWKDGFRA